ncbi:DUF2326 domain-containing protein [Peribacillus frigoritolerans]|uniref:DUF2326 domain-containing protein n=1 Tax=Peribacillus frigoritolerans TaxID=450367 RepID=UPI003513368A
MGNSIADRSHGIAYMKNNLFDLSIFIANLGFSNNAIGFLIHDGSYAKNNEYVKQRIIDEVNRKLKEISIGQYIITINKNELTSETIKKYTEEDLITIKLDRSVDENRLFGFEF